MRSFFGLIGILVAVVPARSDPGPTAMTLPAPAVASAADLLTRDRAELDELFRHAGPAPVPAGFVPGRVISTPGTPTKPAAAALIRGVWQGKIFRPDGTMINRVFGVFRAVPARVYVGESRTDGRPALILDYADTARVFRDVRDEIREVAPGVLLGLTFRDDKPDPVNYFVLDARGGR